MTLRVRHLGQGLRAVDGFHWADPSGHGIGLSATSVAGGPDASGRRNLRFSWYTRLVPIALSPAEQQTLRADLKQKAPTRPRFLDDAAIDDATMLEMQATTSNAEEKRILLIVPDTRPGPPEWLAGFECNSVCFQQDTQPLAFAGRPN